MSQSPQAGQFNSYEIKMWLLLLLLVSQSPQAGQFNSYEFPRLPLMSNLIGLNPLKRVNSILTSSG